VAISELPIGEYKMGKPSGDSIDILDPKSGKKVGKIGDGPRKINDASIRRAIVFLDEGVQRAPWRLDIFVGRAHLYRMLGDLQGELKALDSFVTDPKPNSGHFESGPGGTVKEPLADFQIDMLNSYSNEHFQKETKADDIAGVAVAKLLMKYFPKRAQGYNLMAAAASYKNDWNECLSWLNQALHVAPTDSLVWANKAKCLEKLHDLSGAKECYKEIIRLNNDPDHVKQAKNALSSGKTQ